MLATKSALLFFFASIPLFANAPKTALTEAEQREIDNRVMEFYRNPHGSVMNRHIPKFSVKTNQETETNHFLKGKTTSTNPLIQLAGAKASDTFKKHWCQVAKRNFPALACDKTHSTQETLDLPEDLMTGWVDATKITKNLDEIPPSGATALGLWSDDYWKIQWGMTSYRYATQTFYDDYDTAIAAYAEPDEYKTKSGDLSAEDLSNAITDWSPSEKYDLTVNDPDFSLTAEQKGEGDALRGDDGNVEEWMGICDGWTAATIMTPKPTKAVTVKGPSSAEVTWYPADIRAMASLSWARGGIRTNFVSTNCLEKDPATFPNGRLKDQQCFNTNPATFHVAIGNMIGKNSLSFILDASYDYQIWNQPVHSYSFIYFNPLNPGKRSKNWKDVVVPYDETFKKVDRFQDPMTRGVRDANTNKWDDSRVKSIVGVIATVVYLSETEPPDHTPTETEDVYARVTYTYDLELEEKNGELIATGGEWHENTHPNFLWIPQKDTRPSNDNDDGSLDFDGKSLASQEMTDAAVSASDAGFPLCEVLAYLVNQSSGSDAYKCNGASHFSGMRHHHAASTEQMTGTRKAAK